MITSLNILYMGLTKMHEMHTVQTLVHKNLNSCGGQCMCKQYMDPCLPHFDTVQWSTKLMHTKGMPLPHYSLWLKSQPAGNSNSR
mmetsp:Transcript_54753/g.90289  ORF Transcript_54753/g.90289 Transcript_54753/m.90289 type:complete len:85 (-) Transcript_54753:617-871(-)